MSRYLNRLKILRKTDNSEPEQQSNTIPFYFTRNELHFSAQLAQDYHLYRLFNLNEETKMFIKKGDLGTICHAVPITFQGYF